VARIARALNDAGIPCPSAADPGRNPHRSGAGWTLRTVAAILANPRYTGRQVWNRQRTDFDLVDPGNTALGHKQVQRWNLPDGWVISRTPAHPALVSEADFIAAQEVAVPRGPAGPAVRRYLLAGLLACGRCGRRLESAWSNGRPAYRCRHGYTSATRPGPGRARNTYVREDQILPHLAAVAILLARGNPVTGDESVQLISPAETAGLIDQLRTADITLTYDPDTQTIRTHGSDPVAVTASRDRRQDEKEHPGRRQSTHGSTRHGRRPGPGDNPACAEIAGHGVLTCPRGLEHEFRCDFPGSGNHAIRITGARSTHQEIQRSVRYYPATWHVPGCGGR